MCSKQTQAVRNIIASVEVALIGAERPDLMIENILGIAQHFVNEDGYAFDNALCMACRIYPRTEYCGQAAYAK